MEPVPLRIPCILAAAAAVALAAPPRLSPHELSGFLKMISASVGEANRNKIDCLDDRLASDLKKEGVAIDPSARVGYAESLVQVRTFAAVDKLVVCSDKSLLKDGAALAVVKEGGKPTLYLSGANLRKAKEAGITLSDTVVKIAQVVD